VIGGLFCPRWWGPQWLNILLEMEIRTNFRRGSFGWFWL
jgi:hypothetical protein